MFLYKERDTLKWIEEYFNENEIFYDIGACIGEYGIYAVKKRKVSVFAFEPNALNYGILNKNIYLNNLDNKITALNIALNDNNIISNLSTPRNKYLPGKSHNQFDQSEGSINDDEIFKQGMIGVSLDYLIDNFFLPLPNHIKIDVDGNEHKIINGMQKLLSQKILRTIACEVDYNNSEHQLIIEKIELHGFRSIYLDNNEHNKDNSLFAKNLFFARS